MVSYNQPLQGPRDMVNEAFEKKASDIMDKRFLSLNTSMKLSECAQLLIKTELSGAPVVNDQGRLVGVLSQKDCLKFILDMKYHNSVDADVSNYMSKTVMSIHEDEKILYMTELFIKNNFQLYPVIDEDNILLGVVTRTSLFKEIANISQTNW